MAVMIRKSLMAAFLCTAFLTTVAAMAQPQPPQGIPGGRPPRPGSRFEQRGEGMRPLLPHGRWWKNAEVVKSVGLSDAQVQKIETIFLDSRLKLVDAHAALEKEELQLEPLLEGDTPDEAAVLGAIDRITAARATVEKSNAQMAFAIRRVLTPEQWKKLRTLRTEHRGFPPPAGGPRGHMKAGPQGAAPAAPPSGPGGEV
jgi:Spy/CpxP family protein refolding chaperone